MDLKRSLGLGHGLKVIAGTIFCFSLGAPARADLTVIVGCATSNQDGLTGEACTQVVKVDPGTLIPGETVSTGLSGSGPNSSFSTSASARADYGSLGIAGAVTLVNAALPPGESPGTRTGAVVSNSSTRWSDQVTLSGTPGSLVDVLVTYVVDIHAFDTFVSGEAQGAGLLTLNSTSQPGGIGWCLGFGRADACGAPGSFTALTLGTNVISFTTQMAVGDSIPWAVDFVGSASAMRLAGFDPTAGAASASYDALNTAQSYFTVLTSGSTMVWASGHDYSAPVGAVPEPETYMLFVMGLGMVGWIGRRRKVKAAAAA
jgi:hypothetical protein